MKWSCQQRHDFLWLPVSHLQCSFSEPWMCLCLSHGRSHRPAHVRRSLSQILTEPPSPSADGPTHLKHPTKIPPITPGWPTIPCCTTEVWLFVFAATPKPLQMPHLKQHVRQLHAEAVLSQRTVGGGVCKWNTSRVSDQFEPLWDRKEACPPGASAHDIITEEVQSPQVSISFRSIEEEINKTKWQNSTRHVHKPEQQVEINFKYLQIYLLKNTVIIDHQYYVTEPESAD